VIISKGIAPAPAVATQSAAASATKGSGSPTEMGSVYGTCTETVHAEGMPCAMEQDPRLEDLLLPLLSLPLRGSIAASYSATTKLEPGDRGGSTKQVWTLQLKVKEIERDLHANNGQNNQRG
jgi:hypothetical protein